MGLDTKINLTRHTTYERLVSRDLVDTLALAELLETLPGVLDVGTGGGVPGVLLAIVRPDVSVALADSIGKVCGRRDRPWAGARRAGL